MNISEVKNELDALYSQINPPYGVVPQWHEQGVTDEKIVEIESRLGVTLPLEVREVYKVFSGISHDTPYRIGGRFHDIKEKLLSSIDLNGADFDDDLVISKIEPLEKWGESDELYDPKKEYKELIEYMSQPDSEGKAVFIDCDDDILSERHFIYIGSSYSESVFTNLNSASKDFGSIYNVKPFHPDLIVYKIANGYFDFIGHLKESLRIQAMPVK